MRGPSVLKALLWKEMREWWPLLLVLTLWPPVMIQVCKSFKDTSLEGTIHVLTSMLFLFGIVIWGAMKPVREETAREFENTVVAVNPFTRWVVSVIVPTVAAGLLGAWYHLCYTMIYGALKNMWEPNLVAAITTAFIFLVPWVLGDIFLRWPAVIVGLFFAVFGMSLLTEPNRPGPKDWYMLWSLLAGLVVGSFLCNIVLRTRERKIRRLGALPAPLLAGVAVWFLITAGGVNEHYPANVYTSYGPARIDSQDWSKYVTYSTAPLDIKLNYGNYRTRTFVSHKFKNATAPIDFLGEDRVVLVRQLPRQRDIDVLIWDLKSGKIRKAARINTQPFSLTRQQGRLPRGFVRPDGRYLVLSTTAIGGMGRDLWLIDLKRGTGRIALPDTAFADDSIRWTGKSAILYGNGRIVKIDLASGVGRFADDIALGGGRL